MPHYTTWDPPPVHYATDGSETNGQGGGDVIIADAGGTTEAGAAQGLIIAATNDNDIQSAERDDDLDLYVVNGPGADSGADTLDFAPTAPEDETRAEDVPTDDITLNYTEIKFDPAEAETPQVREHILLGVADTDEPDYLGG